MIRTQDCYCSTLNGDAPPYQKCWWEPSPDISSEPSQPQHLQGLLAGPLLHGRQQSLSFLDFPKGNKNQKDKRRIFNNININKELIFSIIWIIKFFPKVTFKLERGTTKKEFQAPPE